MLSLTRSNADLTSSFLLKWAIPVTEMCSSSASSLSGVRMLRTSVAERLSTLPIPEICAHWIDDDQHDVADPLDGLSQQVQVGDETKVRIFTTDASAINKVDAFRIGAGRYQPWQDSIANAVFGVEPDHIALCCITFVTRQFDSGRNGGCKKCCDLALAHVGHSGDQSELAPGKPAGP